MNAGQLLLIIAEIIDALKTKGIITVNGIVDDLGNVTNDVELAAIVETALTNNGITVPSKVDQIVKMLPLILGLIQ